MPRQPKLPAIDALREGRLRALVRRLSDENCSLHMHERLLLAETVERALSKPASKRVVLTANTPGRPDERAMVLSLQLAESVASHRDGTCLICARKRKNVEQVGTRERVLASLKSGKRYPVRSELPDAETAITKTVEEFNEIRKQLTKQTVRLAWETHGHFFPSATKKRVRAK